MSQQFARFEAMRAQWRERRAEADIVVAELETEFERVARHHPVRRLSGEFQGEEGIRDLTQSFLVHMLSGRLDELFVHATDLEHLRLLMRVRSRQFLANARRRLDFENVRKRAVDILERDDRIAKSGDGASRSWSYGGQPMKSHFSGDESELRTFARRFPLPPSVKRLRRDTEHAPRLISEPDLRALLREICSQAPWALGQVEIVKILRERLGAWQIETISIFREVGPGTRVEDLVGTPDTGFDAVETRLLAEDARALLSVRQLIVLGERFAERKTREQVARLLGVANGTVDNEAQRAAGVILSVADGDFGVAAAVLRQLLEGWMAV